MIACCLNEYQAFSEHEIFYDSVLPEYQAFREHEIFMIVCCLNIKPLVSMKYL